MEDRQNYNKILTKLTMASKDLNNVLDILNEAFENVIEDNVNTGNGTQHATLNTKQLEHAVVENPKSSSVKVYNVVYGKPSTRKHKVWDLDGIVKVDKNVATLLDADGSRVGHLKLETSELVCDSELHIGGKCVKIVEQVFTPESNPPQVPSLPSVSSKETTVLFENKLSSGVGGPKLSRKYILTKKSLLKSSSLLVTKSPDSHSNGLSSANSGTAVSLSRKRPLEEITSETVQSNSQDKRIFNVVYGKPSAKKHKSWENDGTLEVGNGTAILKDAQGKTIETKVKIKDLDKYEAGFETHVGGKCVQILDELKGGQLNGENPPDKPDVTSTHSAAVPWRPIKRSRPSLHSKQEENALVLPKPIVDHQWKHNPSGRPLTDVIVDASLTRVLKPHQRAGLTFLYERVLDLSNLNMEGAILADEMGLGKTLQCIALVWTLLRQGPYGLPSIRKVLIVTPSSLTSNWNDEFKKWLGLTRMCPYHVDKKNKAEDYVYSRVSPVMIISYDMLLRSYDAIMSIEFDLLICDEGHRLKNAKNKLYEMMTSLNIRKRILLSGTPLQNDLQEFFFLNDFVNPGVLGTLKEFKKNFEEPILESRNPGCSKGVKSLGELRSTQLSKHTSEFILRRTSDVQASHLSTKRETIIVCRATPIQEALYLHAVDYWNGSAAARVSHLSVTHALRKICNHPGLVQRLDDEEEGEQDDLKGFLSHHWSTLSDNVFNTAQSGKLLLVESLLRDLEHNTKEKIVIVSYFTSTLDLFEVVCKDMNYAYLRLDGSTNVNNRKSIVDQFNDAKSPHFVLLLSARAGGVGLNLIGASRLVLYDSDWNPATDLQAMARIWRPGQMKPVHIYRLLTAGTVEEKIFQRQISKADLTQCVIDNDIMQGNEPTSKMSLEELKDLFTFEPHTESYVHTSLQCVCSGEGEVPALQIDNEDEEEDSDEDSEESFLEILKKKDNKDKDREREGEKEKREARKNEEGEREGEV
uniref:DNA repair and recombination protein RAD54-like n=1 Tax=Cacopsylla melanoneura TaxID=428564 RepID=A0A8D8WSV6_9HEMI